MAGRGKTATLPAWMMQQGQNQPAAPAGLQSQGHAPISTSGNRNADHDHQTIPAPSADSNVEPKSSDSRDGSVRAGKTYRRQASKFDIPPAGWQPPPGWKPGQPCPLGYPPNNTPGVGAIGLGQEAHAEDISAAPGQQTRHARRLYVGNLPDDVTDDSLRKYFEDVANRALINPLPNDANPVLSTYINRDRRFGFVEFATIELCSACMMLDGLNFQGNTVRMRRPNDYRPETLPPQLRDKVEPLDLGKIADLLQSGGGYNRYVSQTLERTLPKIHVSNIPVNLSENELEQLFGSFGALRGVQIVRDNLGQSKGVAFVQFQDINLHSAVIPNMDGLAIGPNKLSVRAATPMDEQQMYARPVENRPGPSFGMGSGGAAAVAALLQGGQAHTATMSSGAAAAAALLQGANGNVQQASSAASSSRVVKLGNMVSLGELVDDSEYNDIVDDIREECSKFGTLKQVVVPRTGAGSGSVFLEYSDSTGADRAIASLHGRTFGGRSVTAESFSQTSYDRADYL